MCLSGRDIEVEWADVTLDCQILPDVFPVVSAGAAAVLTSWPVVAESVSQVMITKEAALVVASLVEEMPLRVGMVGLIEEGRDLPVDFLGSARVVPDCCSGEVSGRICKGRCCADVLADHY